MAGISIASSILSGEIGANLLEEVLGKTSDALAELIKKGLEADKVQRQLAATAAETGYSFSYLSQQSREFADAANLSAVAAARVTAELAKIASGTNNFGSIGALQKAALDIKAASGLSEEGVSTLFQAIRSGTSDEPLNNAGLADPGRLAQIYADKKGKAVTALSEAEKIQSRVDALMERAALLTGANESYQGSISGQADRASKAVNDFTTSLGASIVQGGTFSNALTTYSELFKQLAVNVDAVNQGLAEGKTPEQIAKEQTQSGVVGSAVDKALFGTGRLLGAGLSLGLDVLTGQVGSGSGALDRANAILDPQTVEYNRQVELIKNQVKNREITEKQAKDNKALLDLKALFDADKTEITTRTGDFNKIRTSVSDTRKFVMDRLVNNVITDVAKAKAILDQMPEGTNKEAYKKLNVLTDEERLSQIEGVTKQVVSTGNIDEIRKQIADLKKVAGTELLQKYAADGLDNLIKPALEKVKELRKQIVEIFQGQVVAGNQDNPFVKFFIDAQQQAEKLRETTKLLSKDAAQVIERQFAQNQERALSKLQFETEQSVLKYAQQAGILEASKIGLDGNQQRQFDALSSRLANVLKIQDLNALEKSYQPTRAGEADLDAASIVKRLNQAQAILNKPKDYKGAKNVLGSQVLDSQALADKQKLLDSTEDDVAEIQNLLGSGGNTESKGLIANAVLNTIGKLPKELLEGQDGGSLRSNALSAVSDSKALADKQLKDELARIGVRQKEDDNALELARRAKASGKSGDIRAANDAILAATSGRSFNELSPELYQLKINANRDLSALTATFQQDSIRILNSMNSGIDKLNTSINDLKRVAEEGGINKLNVVLKNETGQDIRAEQMPRVN